MSPFDGYRITSPFGWRIHPVYKERKFHTGIDLVRPHKDPIYAFTAGEVIFAGEGKDGTGMGGLGNAVAIKDRRGCLHVYAHLDSVVVKKGVMVNRGQMIGRQGNTGVSTGSHLHYEVRKKSQNAPPYGWISDRENQCHEPTQYLVGFYEEEIRLNKKVGSIYPDVPDDHWAASAVKVCKDAGLLAGDSKGNFNGDKPITRYEFAVVLARLQKGMK